MINEKSRERRQLLFSALVTVLYSIITFAILFGFGFLRVGNTSEDFFIRVFSILLLISHNLIIIAIIKREIKVKTLKNTVLVMTAIVVTIFLAELFRFLLPSLSLSYALAGIIVSATVSKRVAIYVNSILSFEILLFGVVRDGFAPGVYQQAVLTFVAGTFLIILISGKATRLKSIIYSIYSIPIFLAVELMCHYIFLGDTQVLLQQLILTGLTPLIIIFFFMGLLPIFESVFKLVTPYKIAELSDVTKGLLKELSEKAPGTFNHCLSVANLASSCAGAVGEDPRLASCVALYHDFGKITDPMIFIENQSDDMANPHEKLTPELSVALIRRHVQTGVETLTKKRMPELIIKGAAEHHGTMPIRIFFEKAKKFTDGNVDIKDYSYEGPTPTNKISAIIMICDAAEAAVRTKADHRREVVDDTVRAIIEERMTLDQFNNCNITFKDLTKIRETIVSSFVGILHSRIEYPKFVIKR